MLFKSVYLGNNEIVKAYKGDSLFYEKQQPTPTDDYVRNGLILFLDGLNQGHEAGKWIDTVGGKEFALTNATQNSDHISFASGYGRCPDSLAYQTLEIVCNVTASTGYMTLWTANGDAHCNIFKNNNNLGFGGTTSDPSIPLTSNSLRQYSALFGTAYTDIKVNNVTQTTTRATAWSSKPTGMNVGYYSSGNYLLTADVYAIRLYNRQLTDAERTQNDQRDVQRFGLS